MKLYDDEKGTVFILSDSSINLLEECEQYAIGDYPNLNIEALMEIYYSVTDRQNKNHVAQIIAHLLRINAPKNGSRGAFYAAQQRRVGGLDDDWK